MPGFTDVRERLEAAEHAANAGDLASANDLLRDVARIQEADLGPLHPDLANTLNNLAIVAEQTGHPEDAEAFYRRAVAIASASLPPDHPMVAASRQNLEDFCRARGLPLEIPTVAPVPVPDSSPEVDAFPAEEFELATTVPVPEPVTPRAPTTTDPTPQPSRGGSRALAIIAIAAIVGAVGLALLWPRSSPEVPPLAPAVAVTASPSSETAASPPAAAVPEPAPPPKVVAGNSGRAAGGETAAPARAAADVSLVTAQLCQTFSTAGSTWTCSQAGDSVTSGPLVLYTRVKSPRDAVVVHRWYRGDVLRQSVELKTRANVTEGYRTYSRQTVDRGEWRVEVRSATGAVIHEQRFVVR